MTPDDWEKIESIFQQAVDLPKDQQEKFVRSVCAGNLELLQEVSSLLENQQEEPQPKLIKAISEVSKSFPAAKHTGDLIGPYRIIERIGQGGMGIVYRAVRDDQDFLKEVALKLVSYSLHDEFMQAKFRSERGILALLEHPYIARLLDGGNAKDGTPYFAMEFVDGIPIDEYCEVNNLSISDRLRLFRKVCSAVQYLHQNLIIHRDLKPNNILVTADGDPKLLDFGIAKLLASQYSPGSPLQTMTVMRIMTPDYASPEQVLGGSITTASDIYALGALLFELLTGKRAHQLKTYTPTEIERIVCHTEIEKPSTVAKSAANAKLRNVLSGDLDNIVLMAMRKEPLRRYASVEQFSEDIQRHLDNRPVLARSDTFVYRAGKFARRHGLAVASVALVMLSLLSGILIAMYQAKRADAEAKRAERRFEQVHKLANAFLFKLHDKIQNLPGSTEAREMVVETALEYLDSLASEAEGDTSLQWELAVAYQKVGDVQGNPWGPNLGHTRDAMKSYQKGLTLAQAVVSKRPDQTRLRTLAECYFKLGALQSEAGEKINAGVTLRRALEIAEPLEQKSAKEEDFVLTSNILARIGDVHLDTGDPASALNSYQRMRTIMVTRAEKFPSDDATSGLAEADTQIGGSRILLGDLQGAIESYESSANMMEQMIKRHPENVNYLRNLSVVHSWLGTLYGDELYVNRGDTNTALEHARRSVALTEQVTKMDPKNALAVQDLAIYYGHLGDLLSKSNAASAAEIHKKALGMIDHLLAEGSDDFLLLRRKGSLVRGLSIDFRNLHRIQEAVSGLRQSREILNGLLSRDSSNNLIRRLAYITISQLGNALMDAKTHSDALEAYQESMKLAEKWAAAHRPNAYDSWQLADSYSNLGSYYAQLHDVQEAREWYQKSLNVWNDWPKHLISSSFNLQKREEVSLALSKLK